MKVTIIGAGNMGGAIACGLADGSLMRTDEIACADFSQEALEKIRAKHPDIRTTRNNREAVREADIILLAVKPWLVQTVIPEIKDMLDYRRQMIVSIAAGITFAQLADLLTKNEEELPALFRVIPNTAVSVRRSMTVFAAQGASPEQTNAVASLFGELGVVQQMEERLMTAGTALASCGIAYAFRYIRAATEGGVELGFYPEQAKDIVLQTLKGAVALLEANGTHAEVEIDKVCTPGGITIRGLNEMEHAGFTSAVIRGLKVSGK